MKKKHYLLVQLLSIFFLLLQQETLFAQSEKENYVRFFDSADVYVVSKPKLADRFLDSIPEPSKKYIDDQVGRYYAIRARIQSELNDFAESYRLWLLSLKAAEEIDNLNFAAYASIQISMLLYDYGNDEEGEKYINKAIDYYGRTGHTDGIMETKQVPAYHKFQKGEWEDCIEFLNKDLSEYKTHHKGYLYAFALHMLACSHFNLDNYDQGIRFSKMYDNVENGDSVTDLPYYKAYQKFCRASYLYKNEVPDSVLYYINEIYQLEPEMDEGFKSELYNLAINTHDVLGNEEMKLAYSDSLTILEAEIKEANIRSGLKVSENLVSTQEQLDIAANRQKRNLILALGVLVVSILTGIFFYRNHIGVRRKLSGLKNKLGELTYLKHNQEKLGAKIKGLEDYIDSLKSDIKQISQVSDVNLQKRKIRDLYKTLHLDSSNIIKNGNNHLELINDLNVEFFKSLSDKYPNLNSSEKMICYYVHMGFKNKEIAFFLNSSVRSVESKRYRLNKKMNVNTNSSSLNEHLIKLVKEA